MSRLDWISDDKLEGIVNRLLERSKDGVQESSQRMQKNVMDPFASFVMAAAMDISEPKPLYDIQRGNSASQAISNAVGSFHQEVLGNVSGFNNHDAGYDLECIKKSIIAEVKNKHNTMNAPNRAKVISDLETAVRQKSGKWTAYLVIVVPKKPARYTKKLIPNREVYEIDGASFYEIATSHKTALRDLYDAVENIILDRYPNTATEKVRGYCKAILQNSLPT